MGASVSQLAKKGPSGDCLVFVFLICESEQVFIKLASSMPRLANLMISNESQETFVESVEVGRTVTI